MDATSIKRVAGRVIPSATGSNEQHSADRGCRSSIGCRSLWRLLFPVSARLAAHFNHSKHSGGLLRSPRCPIARLGASLV